MAAVSGADTLDAILVCGIMGVLGQGVRAAVGLKSSNSLPAGTPNAQTEFSAAYFALSLMIGFIAGVLAGIATGLNNFISIDLSDPKLILGIALSGYAGADFIENSLSIFVPPKTAPAPAAAEDAPVQEVALREVSQPGLAPLATTFPISSTALTAAFSVSAPRVSAVGWVPSLLAAFERYDLGNNRRVAVAVGQFLVEAGAAFQELRENLTYTTAARLVAVFPREFPDETAAEPYLNNPEKLGNFVYANRGGNGDAASGDGYMFRGRGLIQLTGRTEYEQFGTSVNKTPSEAAAYCETVEGAAMSGCWYLSSRGCLPFADSWNITEVTKRVNGSAMLGEAQRVAYAQSFLKHLGG